MKQFDMQNPFHTEAFHNVPLNIAVIDRDYRIVEANRFFEEKFGPWKDRYCYQTYKRCDTPCESCLASETFRDGVSRSKEEAGVDREGKFCYYVVHTHAIRDENGSIPYVIEYSNDITESKEFLQAGRVLFDRAPCYVQVLDRNLRVVMANKAQKKAFGESVGKHCYEVYKQRKQRCHHCPALLAFQDKQVHKAEQIGICKDGRQALYSVTAAPLTSEGDEVAHVIEISMDTTTESHLRSDLQKAYALEDSIISNSMSGIVAFDKHGQLMVFNPTAEKLLNCPVGYAVSGNIQPEMFPEAFQKVIRGEQESCYFDETEITACEGEKIPVRFSGVTLHSEDGPLGCAAFFLDLRTIKSLEAEKLEAERLAAVGETVAGLAHSVKNVLQALEGGIYAIRSGIETDNQKRIHQGWPVLEKNFDKISQLVKDFLSFSKGRSLETRLVNLNDLVEEVVELYDGVASRQHVKILADLDYAMPPAPFDASGMHTCLTNLLSNAIDACIMSEKQEGTVTLRTCEREGVITLDIQDDGVGMDADVKRRVFTTFFTTKGGGGTGLGLLTSRKIIQEHGGKIHFESKPAKGSLFRIEFPRNRLPKPAASKGKESL